MAGDLRFAFLPEPTRVPQQDGDTPFAEPKKPSLKDRPLRALSKVKHREIGLLEDMADLENVPVQLQPIVIPLAGDNRPIFATSPEEREPPYAAQAPGRYLTAQDYHEMYRSGKTTPLQVAETLIGIIKQYGEGLYDSAWVYPRGRGKETRVLASARASTDRYAQGKYLGPFDGCPMGIEDSLNVEGFACQYGMAYNTSQPYAAVKGTSEWTVQRLLNEGAIIIGKTRMQELGLGTTGCNAAQGTPANPMNNAYCPGGSSSGGAAAVSDGIVPITVGNDSSGGVRIPASFCGVYGLKPTFQRISLRPESTCSTGVMAASVQDLRFAYRVMAQQDLDCPIRSHFGTSQPPISRTPRTLGFYRPWWDVADPRVVDLCHQTMDYLRANEGFKVVDIEIPYLTQARAAHAMVVAYEAVEATQRLLEDDSREWKKPLSKATSDHLAVQEKTKASEYLRATAVRSLLMRHMAYLFRKDLSMLIITPTSPLIGWPRSLTENNQALPLANATTDNTTFTFVANMTGLPAISVPIGYIEPERGTGPLPVGIMAMAAWGNEEALLAFAKHCEEMLYKSPGGRTRPESWVDVLGVTAKKRRVEPVVEECYRMPMKPGSLV